MSEKSIKKLLVRKDVLAELTENGEQDALGMITIRKPEFLKKCGWKEPYPSYVSAAPSLWQLWLDQTTRK